MTKDWLLAEVSHDKIFFSIWGNFLDLGFGWTAQLQKLSDLEEQQKSRWRGKWDIRVWFPSRDEESDEWFLDDKTTCDDDNIPSLEQEAPFHYGWFSPVWKKCLLQQQNCVQLIFLYFPFYGTNGIAVKFCCYTLLFTLLFVSLILTCFYWGSLIGSLIMRSRLKFCLSPVIPMDYTG